MILYIFVSRLSFIKATDKMIPISLQFTTRAFIVEKMFRLYHWGRLGKKSSFSVERKEIWLLVAEMREDILFIVQPRDPHLTGSYLSQKLYKLEILT